MPQRRWFEQVRISPGSGFLRRLAYLGSHYGPHGWLRYSPPVFGLLFAAGLPEQRAAVRENLRRVRGRRGGWVEQFDVARTFCSYAQCLAEGLAAQRPEAAAAQYVVRGEQNLRSAAAGGRGFITATAHFGAWDTAARLLARDLRRDVMVVMAPETDPRARVLHDAVRTGEGVTVIHVVHPLQALSLLRHLRQGGIVAVQLDRLLSGMRYVEVTLFGRPFALPIGPFQLAAVARCPVLPVFVHRLGHFRYEVRVGRPIDLGDRPGRQALRDAAQFATSEMEQCIAAHPTQWFHFSRFDQSGREST